MSIVSITQSLRPLKLVYLVKPNDMSSLKKIIETNSFLWGGRYNAIIPFYKKNLSFLKTLLKQKMTFFMAT